MELILVNVNENTYAYHIEYLERFIARQDCTYLAHAPEFVEGVMDFEGEIIPIVSQRKLFGSPSFFEEQLALLNKVTSQHHTWVEEFKSFLIKKTPFAKTLDPHACDFGKWLDKVHACLKCNNNGFVTILNNEIMPPHSALHLLGQEIITNSTNRSLEENLLLLDKYYQQTMEGIAQLRQKMNLLVNSYERIVVYAKEGVRFGILVDHIEKIIALSDNALQSNTLTNQVNKLIKMEGTFEYDGAITTVIDFVPEFLDAIRTISFTANSRD